MVVNDGCDSAMTHLVFVIVFAFVWKEVPVYLPLRYLVANDASGPVPRGRLPLRRSPMDWRRKLDRDFCGSAEQRCPCCFHSVSFLVWYIPYIHLYLLQTLYASMHRLLPKKEIPSSVVFFALKQRVWLKTIPDSSCFLLLVSQRRNWMFWHRFVVFSLRTIVDGYYSPWLSTVITHFWPLLSTIIHYYHLPVSTLVHPCLPAWIIICHQSLFTPLW